MGSLAVHEKKGALRVTKKKIMDALEQCAKTSECYGCPYEDHAACKTILLRDVFKIVKEQEKKIKELEKVKPLVRCKDCKWHDNSTGECTNIESICWRNGCARDDFYCAEGERK